MLKIVQQDNKPTTYKSVTKFDGKTKSVVAQRINEKLENIKTNISKQYQRTCDRFVCRCRESQERLAGFRG